jgi:hypothetical protein
MPSEHAFLRQRLALVEHWLEKPDQDSFSYVKGRLRRQTRTSRRWTTVRYRREARLLQKLLAQTREGQAVPALQAWRGQLAEFLIDHQHRYEKMQRAYDSWWQMPLYRRQSTPQPPKPPSARYIDGEGAPWIIDDRFLALFDDLAKRLQKWLDQA